jgi:hypothetical protein
VSRRLASAALLAVVAAAVAGCTSTVSLQPSPLANDPACAEVMARLPDSLGGEARRWTDAQATAAWGDPTSVILSCGLAELGPTELPCRTVADVDWVIDESDAPRYRVTTFNRTPAVEVYLDNEVVSSADVLGVLSSRVAVLPSNDRACTTVEDAG